MQPRLFALSGADAGRSFDVAAGTTLGRNADCGVVLRDHSVSRHHAHFELENGLWYIVDDGSRNGVLVAGERVARAEIADQQEFQLGDLLFRFRIQDQAAVPLPPGAPPEPASSEFEEEIVLEGFDELAKSTGDAAPERGGAIVLGPEATIQAHKTREPAAASETMIARRPPVAGSTPSPAAVAAAAARGATAADLGQRKRILQFHKEADRRGFFVADLSQSAWWVRVAVYGLVLILFLALAYAAFRFTTSARERMQESGGAGGLGGNEAR